MSFDRRSRFALILLVLVILSLFPLNLVGAQNGNSQTYIVVFKGNVTDVKGKAQALGNKHGFAADQVYEHALKGMAVKLNHGQLQKLQAEADVAYIEADMLWTIQAQTTPTGLGRSFASSNPNLDIDGLDDLRVNVDVAVIDTGVDSSHPDLNVVNRVDCARNQGCRMNSGSDGNGHGTHVAGTIGAKDNGIGVVGVAPGARIWSVRVLNNAGSGYTSWILAGINYVAANSASIEVANMSLGGTGSSSTYSGAIGNAISKGVVFVVAAGNSDMNASGFTPANVPDAITVSALADFNGLPGGGAAATCRADVDDTLADFSNWGSIVDIAAPGVCIYSTWKGGGYNTISGTSMASPHVAGAAALLASRSNPASRADVMNIATTLRSTGNTNWTDDSGDGVKEPLMDVSNTSTYAPVMTAP